MNHEVFISYSELDKPKADAVCSLLERKKIRCWVAPRDILPGMTWGSSIVRAIQQSRVFILVFSSHSNHSPQVVREVERAVRHAVPIIPFRIEEATPTGDMEYFISAQHWLDAVDPPLERHIERLASVVKRLLEEEDLRPQKDLGPAGTKDGAEGATQSERHEIAESTTVDSVLADAGAAKSAPADSPAAPATLSGATATGTTQLPPRVDRFTSFTDALKNWRQSPQSSAKPFFIAGGILGGVLGLGILVIVLIAVFRSCEDDVDDYGTVFTPPMVGDSIPTDLAGGFSQTFTLVSGVDGIHSLPVPEGETRTVTVEADSFDAVLEVWRHSQRIDVSASQAEEAILSPGSWVISVEGYGGRGGNFQWTVADGVGTILSEQQSLLPATRRSAEVLVPSNETRQVSASSTDFDVVLIILEKTERKDATLAGSPEEVVLVEGSWELIVKSYVADGSGDYMLTVR